LSASIGKQNPKSERVSAGLRGVLLSILLVYVAWLLAHVAWYSVAGDSHQTLSLAEPKASAGQRVSGKSAQLPSWHLFGKVGAGLAKKTDAPKEAPKTRLRLVLKGVFTGEQGGESGAIIEEIGRTTEYYRLGDKVAGNATLEEVYSDRVLLRRSGKLETLAFEMKASLAGGIAKNTPVRREKPANANTIDTPEQFLEEATRQLSSNPDQALKSVGLQVGEGGGYVYQGNNPMLAGMNLQKGDVILSVNGHTLGDIQKDKELMGSLYEQGMIEVEVVRDGASFFVNYPLR